MSTEDNKTDMELLAAFAAREVSAKQGKGYGDILYYLNHHEGLRNIGSIDSSGTRHFLTFLIKEMVEQSATAIDIDKFIAARNRGGAIDYRETIYQDWVEAGLLQVDYDKDRRPMIRCSPATIRALQYVS